jgi:hypothetical protein
MPHNPHTRNEIRANAPKPSQQSKANRNNGTKARHIHSSPGVEMGKWSRRAARISSMKPCRAEDKKPLVVEPPKAGVAGEVNASHRFYATRFVGQF